MKGMIISMLFCCATFITNAQNVGIGTTTPDPSSALEIRSTNKGLLLPRVNDTSSIADPAKGLAVFSLRNNKIWFYNGNRWQQSVSNTGGMDSIWYKLNDSIVYTGKKYVGINTDAIWNPRAELEVKGNLLLQGDQVFSRAAPTVAQTYTMINNSTDVADGDSVFRIFDPGGTGNYGNNVLRDVFVAKGSLAQEGFRIRFNPADFGIGEGDTLWISSLPYPGCRTHYSLRITSESTVPEDMVTADNICLFTFKTDNAIVLRGFDITVRRLFTTLPVKEDGSRNISTSGSAFYFFNGSLSAGYNSNAIGEKSIALGDDATTYGQNGVAIGNDVLANGFGSVAIGNTSIASGNNSMVFGFGAGANGDNSLALGANATTFGLNSISMGINARSYGVNSIAAGASTIARPYSGIALGIFNDDTDTPPGDFPDAEDRIFQVGNGRAHTNRSNALTILRNGNIGVGVLVPHAPLHFPSTEANRKIVLYETINNETEYFGFGINFASLRYNAAANSSHDFWASTLHILRLQPNGNATLTGILTQNSDARLKKDMQPLLNNLHRVLKVNGYSYKWKDPARDQQPQIGLLAQEVRQVFPELVQADKEGILSVNYAGLTPVLIEAIRELYVKIQQQQKQIDRLQRDISKQSL
jgi:hypothetical protein